MPLMLFVNMALCKCFTQIKQAWEYDSIAERTANAGHLKERGTKYFKLGKYQLACGLYNRGAELYDNIDDLDDSAKVMQVALHLNQAACHLKLSEPSLAIKECEEVCNKEKLKCI